ncbi:MAG: D-tyrosyl-tRNA(Tyr) deacylase, partial [Methanoregula sp.]|nr:D-tyrosyl-tRNA(Tyr) deacylase [Methanoregula sp.]
MRIALVNSRQDKAGQNIRHHIEHLLDRGDFVPWHENGHTYEFFEIEERLIHAEAVDREIEADLLVFLSRH